MKRKFRILGSIALLTVERMYRPVSQIQFHWIDVLTSADHLLDNPVTLQNILFDKVKTQPNRGLSRHQLIAQRNLFHVSLDVFTN